MANFPIKFTERTISGRGPSVRANINVRQGDVGKAVGQGLILGGRILRFVKEKERIRLEKIAQKRQQMMDANFGVQAKKLRDLADEEFDTYKLTNPQETWVEFRQKQTVKVAEEISKLPFSPDVLAKEQLKAEAYSEVSTAKALTDSTLQLRTDTIEALTESLTDAFRSGEPEEIVEAVKVYRDNGANMGKDKVEVLNDIKAAREAGEKLRVKDAISGVHAAIEAASEVGNFEVARELAKNPIIPEPQQTTLRNTINSAEKAKISSIKDAQQQLINKTTSDTIREYFNDDLTVPILNARHEDGLIKDSEFKFMMTGLTKTTPVKTDPFAAGNIRRAMADFNMGAISRAEADKAILENYVKLDDTDREKVVADLEDEEAKIIAAAKSNAYDEGKGLMSRRFVGIQTEEDLIDLFRGAGLTDEEKDRINRRWTAEINNRSLYERAIDDRFREMRQEKISDVNKYRTESLRILLQYQRRGRLSLEELEIEVGGEQQEILVGTVKPIGEMTTEEKQAELARIRELKQLTK